VTALAVGGSGFEVHRRWRRQTSGPLADPGERALAHIGARRGVPVVGAMPEIVFDPLAFARRMVERHGPVYRFLAMGRWHVHAVGAEAHERILFDTEGSFSAEQGWGPLVSPLLPGALLTRDGSEHRARRRLLGEAFRQTELSGYRGIFARNIEAAVASWQSRTIDSFPATKRLAFDIAASTFLGVALEERGEEALRLFARIASGLLALSYNRHFSIARARALRAKASLETLLGHLAASKRAAPENDFLSRLCLLEDEDGAALSGQEIADSLIFLLVAAHDTMSSALTSCLKRLAMEPEWAERLRAELAAAGVRRCEEAALAPLPLFDMFYKECLRLDPPAPLVWRRALRDVEVRGVAIPAGTMTAANIMMSHRMKDEWPDAAAFDPLRFSPAGERGRHRFAFAPFGAGIHKCLGMHFSQQQARMFVGQLLLTSEVRVRGVAPPSYAWPSARPRGSLRLAIDPRCRGR
jgi:cytochrome P450